jgi:hypothetical protein
VGDLNRRALKMKDQLFEAMEEFPLMVKAEMTPRDLRAEIEATYGELRAKTNDIAHAMAVTEIGKKYVDEVRDNPSKKYVICPDESAAAAKSSIAHLGSPATRQDTNAPAPSTGERSIGFAQDTEDARAKARALAELRLEEMDVREQQMQLKLERIQARRELLELGTDE